MSLPRKEIVMNYFSFGASILYVKENYKDLKVFTNVVLFTHGLTEYKHQNEEKKKPSK